MEMMEGGRDDDDVASSDLPVNFYVHAPSRTDPVSVCPPGHDAITILVPCPTLDEGGDDCRGRADDNDDALIGRARELVVSRFHRAGVEDVEKHIVAEEIVGPSTWRARYGLHRGAVFGLAHPLTQLAIFRPGPRHPHIDGLYFVGASARPGNGVPLVLIGATQTSNAVAADA